jgi:hypothetical protein
MPANGACVRLEMVGLMVGWWDRHHGLAINGGHDEHGTLLPLLLAHPRQPLGLPPSAIAAAACCG